MEFADVPPALQSRLGVEGTASLLALFETARQEWTADMTTAAVERFERRLTEESAGLRIALAQGESALHKDMGDLGSALRKDMGDLGSALRREMGDLGSGLRKEMSDLRVELVRWSFAFWVGQVIATAGIVAAMLQFLNN